MQSFVSLSIVTVIWFFVGYSLCFSGDMTSGTDFFGILGNFDKSMLLSVDMNSDFNQDLPEFVFFLYQMMFAIITPALITGAFADRVDFKAYLIFLIGWLFLVYFPFVHMIWGGGILAELGVLDFAGGIVVHATAGFAALASVFFVGKRKDRSGLHSIPLVALGTGLLWFGWYGFNAGSELAVDRITIVAFLNTDLAASVAGLTWLLLAWIFERKPKFVGLLTGMVAGLATITPAAGFVSPQSAVLIGFLAGVVCYGAIWVKNHLGWDDALDVWGVHGIGGVLGTICLGIFAEEAINAVAVNGGLLSGNISFFVIQVLAVVVAVTWAFAFTFAMLYVIDRFTPIRVAEDVEINGLDAGIHGEAAYEQGAF